VVGANADNEYDLGIAPPRVHLDFDGIRFNAVDGRGTDLGQHPEVWGEFREKFNLDFCFLAK
jgi:hypothetical protein